MKKTYSEKATKSTRSTSHRDAGTPAWVRTVLECWGRGGDMDFTPRR